MHNTRFLSNSSPVFLLLYCIIKHGDGVPILNTFKCLYLTKLAFSELLNKLDVLSGELYNGEIVGPQEVRSGHGVGVAASHSLYVGHVDNVCRGVVAHHT